MKSIPQRMCVVTREKTDKNKLLRIVKDNLGNVSVDETGKKNGKGAYITKDLEVLETAKKKKVLEKVFEIEDLTSVYEEIYNLIK
ncbi:MAG: YlxR family protein [Firmicutes bacterium]|jgi:hypothetical protein|nr:YlxR family protein [Bacillota bacterium]